MDGTVMEIPPIRVKASGDAVKTRGASEQQQLYIE